jgi:hypothetical protein
MFILEGLVLGTLPPLGTNQLVFSEVERSAVTSFSKRQAVACRIHDLD